MKKITSLLLCFLVCLSLFTLPATAADNYRTWLQADSRWGSITFGDQGDTLARTGCAVTSIAKLMVHSGAVVDNTEKFNPGIFCNWLKEHNGFTSQGWIYWGKPGEYTSKFTYEGEALLSGSKTQKAATIASHINDGCVVVARVKNGGHYVAVEKVVGSTVYIMDSANTGYTNLFNYSESGVDKIHIYKGPHNGTGSNQPTYDTTIDPVGTKYIITSSDGVNLRSGAGTSNEILTAIPNNTTVTVTKTQNGWGYTTYAGKSGWFSLDYAKGTVTLRGLQVTPPTKTQYEIGEKLNTQGMKVTALYSDGSSKTISSGYATHEFSSQKEGECTVYVTYQEKAATFTVTIAKKQVTYLTGTYKVQAEGGLRLRKAPSTEGQELGFLPDGIQIAVTAVQENWGKVVYQETEGWICLDYTIFVEETVKQVGLEASYQKPYVFMGDTLNQKDFQVFQVFSDGTKVATTNYTFSVQAITNGSLPLTISQEEFQTQITIKVLKEIPFGDSNLDDLIDAKDALNILKASVNKPMEEFYPEFCDVNNDEFIDAKDALLVLRFAVNKIQQFPVEETVTPTDITPTCVVL